MKKAKRTLTVLLAVLLMVGLVPGASLTGLLDVFSALTVEAHAETLSGDCGLYVDNVKWKLDTSTGTLTISGKGEMERFGMINVFCGREPTWEPYRDLIRSVIIGDGVTSIGARAFRDCEQLSFVSISDTVIEIGAQAFDNTAFYNNKTNWEDGVLYSGRHLLKADETIAGGYSVLSGTLCIAADAFRECINLVKVSIPDGVKNIGEGAFDFCVNLSDISLPDSVEKIGRFALSQTAYASESKNWSGNALYIGNHLIRYNLSDSGEFKVASHVLCIEDNLFNSPDLTRIVVDDNNANYSSDESGVLFNKDKTVLIRFPAGKKTVSYSIPDSVAVIGKNAFEDVGLSSLSIPTSVTHIEDDAFFGARIPNMTIPSSVVRVGNDAFLNCGLSVTIENGVSIIGDYAFFDYGPDTVTIPASVTKIGVYAFGYDHDAFVVDENNLSYCNDKNGVLYNKDKTTLIQYPCKNTSGSFTVADGVKRIEHMAFCHADIEKITLPEGLDDIGNSAFGDCRITEINIPGSVNQIGYYAFDNCENLKQVKIGNGLKIIKNGVFSGCKGLESVIIPDSVTIMGSYVFQGCSKLDNVHFPQGISVIEENVFVECTELKYICSDTADCYAKTYAEANGIPFRVCGGKHPQTVPQHPDSIPQISAEYEKGTFDGNVSLLAQKVSQEELKTGFPQYEFGLKPALGEALTDIYFIRVVDEAGNTVQPNEGYTVTLRIPVPAGYDYTKCRICHVVDSDKKLTESFKWNASAGSTAKPLTVSEDGKYLVLEVSSFSPFIVFGEARPEIRLTQNTTKSTLPFGEKRILTADVKDLPDRAKIVWTADKDGIVTLKPSEDGLTCEVQAKKSGNVTITATIVDADGKEIKQNGNVVSAGVTLQTKAGFFHKLFFWIFRIPWPWAKN